MESNGVYSAAAGDDSISIETPGGKSPFSSGSVVHIYLAFKKQSSERES